VRTNISCNLGRCRNIRIESFDHLVRKQRDELAPSDVDCHVTLPWGPFPCHAMGGRYHALIVRSAYYVTSSGERCVGAASDHYPPLAARKDGIGFFEQPHVLLDIVALLQEAFWVPLAAYGIKKVTAVDVDRARQTRNRVSH
jgi:hypothetical protein